MRPGLISRLRRLTAEERGLLAEAVAWLALARLALLVLPFGVIAPRLGRPLPPSTAPDALDARGTAQARLVGWAVTRAAAHVPFRAVCLQQAVAAKLMLRRRGVAASVHLGVMKTNALAAHAWTDAGSVEVTGYPVAPGMVEVARFA